MTARKTKAPPRFLINIEPTTGRRQRFKWEALEWRRGYFGDREDESWDGYYPLRAPNSDIYSFDEAKGTVKSYCEAATKAAEAVAAERAREIKDHLIAEFKSAHATEWEGDL